jgi:hypothetical protein
LNIGNYKDIFTLQGIRNWLVEKFASAAVTVVDANKSSTRLQATVKTTCKTMNVSSFNDLYKQFNNILRVGKILYWGSNAAT